MTMQQILDDIHSDRIKKVIHDADMGMEMDDQYALAFCIGAKDKMEMELVPRAGYDIEGITVTNLRRSGGMEMIMDNMTTLIVGNAVAFIVAMLAIKGFIKYVQKYGFKAFGWYRIILGGLILLLLLTGHNLTIA